MYIWWIVLFLRYESVRIFPVAHSGSGVRGLS